MINPINNNFIKKAKDSFEDEMQKLRKQQADIFIRLQEELEAKKISQLKKGLPEKTPHE